MGTKQSLVLRPCPVRSPLTREQFLQVELRAKSAEHAVFRGHTLSVMTDSPVFSNPA
jgi:hypothetical protein